MQAQKMTYSQVEKYADQLVARHILTTQGKAALLKEKKENQTDPLEFLAGAFQSAQIHRLMQKTGVESKITPEDSLLRQSWGFTSFGPRPYRDADYISPKRSTIGLTRSRTLNDLKAIGLIDEMVYQACKKGLEDHSIKDEPELLNFAFQMSMYYANYDRLKRRQAAYISKLADAGLITKACEDSILHSYKPYELKEEVDILAYSDRYRMVDLRGVEADPAIIYPIIFDKIKELLPDFHYTDLQTRLIEKLESDLVKQSLMLSFSVGERVYTHTLYYNFRKKVPDPTDPDTPSRVNQDFHKGVNKWLTDLSSPYRLYPVNLPEEGKGPYGHNKLGLLLLKKGEAELISEDGYFLSHESFDNRLSQDNIRKIIKEFSDKGFFRHLSTREIDSAQQLIPSTDISSIESLLLSFPKTIVYFDWETGNLENPYEDLTRQFANASRGAFTPSYIVDGFKKGWPPPDTKTIRYGFTFNGKRYESDLKFNGDWLEPEFFDMIRQALKDHHIDGDFYYCISDGQASGHIFLSREQYAFVKEKYPDLLKDDIK